MLAMLCLGACTGGPGDLSETDVTTATQAPQVVEAQKLLHQGIQIQRAIALLQDAATQGNPIAQFSLASLYHQGIGVPVDDIRSVALLQQSAMAGLGEAQIALGRAYLLGQGVPQDRQQEFYWLQQAADQDDPQVWVHLGDFYLVANDIARANDDAESTQDANNIYLRNASQQFLRAAKAGNADGQYQLCRSYAAGSGLRMDRYVGLQWCNKAAAQSQSQAVQLADALRAEGVLDHPVNGAGTSHSDGKAPRVVAEVVMDILFAALMHEAVSGAVH
jgi:TPR repeat protein